MHSVFINEVDSKNEIIQGRSKGKRLTIIPRVGEMYIMENEIFTVLAVAHDFDTEETITYLTVRFLKHYGNAKNNENLH